LSRLPSTDPEAAAPIGKKKKEETVIGLIVKVTVPLLAAPDKEAVGFIQLPVRTQNYLLKLAGGPVRLGC